MAAKITAENIVHQIALNLQFCQEYICSLLAEKVIKIQCDWEIKANHLYTTSQQAASNSFLQLSNIALLGIFIWYKISVILVNIIRCCHRESIFADVNIDVTDVNIMILRYRYLNEKTMFAGRSYGCSHFGSCAHIFCAWRKLSQRRILERRHRVLLMFAMEILLYGPIWE